MEKNAIQKTLIEIYKGYINDEKIKNEINADSKLESLNISSVDYIKIIIDIENEFNFEFGDYELAPGTFSTVSDMVAYISKKVE